MPRSVKTKSERVQNKPAIKPYDLEKAVTEIVDWVKEVLPESKSRLKFLSMFGVGVEHGGEYYTCHKCGQVLPKKEFYMSSEMGCESGITPICKSCASSLAEPVIAGQKQLPTKESVINALDFLRKPYLDSVWDDSILEAANTMSGKTKNNVWTSYIKNIQMKQYYGLTYSNSDFYTGGTYSLEDVSETSRDKEIIEAFEKNKLDTLRLLGYLPFEKEKTVDQPFLYAQLIGFLDASEEGNDDMMRTSSIISIVRGFLQLNQIDDMIANLTRDTKNIEANVAKLRGLQAMKQSISRMITELAKESCISLKNTKNAKKGENTWTGKLKKIKELNLREGEVNGFDLNTCKGMMQVMEMSDASIMKQLHLDESEWSDMVAEQRIMIRSLQNKLDFYAEAARIILRENLDLRDTLTEHGLLDCTNLTDIEELYSPLISDYVEAINKEEGFDDNDDEVIDDEIDFNDSEVTAPEETGDNYEYSELSV